MFDTGILLDAVREIADVDVRVCSDDDLMLETLNLSKVISLAQTAQAHRLAELDARGTTDRLHGMRTTAWVAASTGCARGPLTGRLRVGRALRDHFDKVDDAVLDGRLGFDHAKALTDVTNPRITDILASAQEEIIALTELLRIATGAEPGSGAAPRAEVTLVVHDNETCDAQGAPLPRAAVDVWGCDPEVWAVVVNEMGIPVDVGHTKRLATIAQRRAIAVRDGGCTFPGCDAPIDWCDHHHVVDWHQGGPTDLANLVALCRHHHGVTHRVGWTMTLDDDQLPHWTSPGGDRLVGQRHHRRFGSRPPDRWPPPIRPADPVSTAVAPLRSFAMASSP